MTRSAIISILALALLAAACGPVATGPSATASGPAAASTPHSPAPTPSAGAVPEDLSSIWFRKTDTTMQWDGEGTWILGFDNPPEILHGNEARSTARALDAETFELVSTVDADGCRTGDTGTYDWSLSESRRTMTLESRADECARRMADLPGTWIRSDCPAYPEDFCLGPLDPGPHVTNFFEPQEAASPDWQLDPAAMAYVVAEGWSNTYDAVNEYTLEPLVKTGDTGVYMWTDVTIVADARPCGTSPRPGGRASPAAFVAWLAEQETLKTAQAAKVNVGGLEGLLIDLEVRPGAALQCSGDGVPYAPFLVHVEGSGLQWGFKKDTRNRLYFLDLTDGRTLVIDVAAEDADAAELLAEGIEIVESIELRR